jgi:hypothetical protein
MEEKKNNKYCSLTHRIILIKSNLNIKIELFNLTEKFENFDLESCNNIFTPEIESIMLATKVLKGIKKKKEVKNDLLSNSKKIREYKN